MSLIRQWGIKLFSIKYNESYALSITLIIFNGKYESKYVIFKHHFQLLEHYIVKRIPIATFFVTHFG